MNAYSISKLAEDACVSVQVVRDYMIRGVLLPARRTESG
jgi:MerR family mercuric resistance operon transcriptional regulator